MNVISVFLVHEGKKIPYITSPFFIIGAPFLQGHTLRATFAGKQGRRKRYVSDRLHFSSANGYLLLSHRIRKECTKVK